MNKKTQIPILLLIIITIAGIIITISNETEGKNFKHSNISNVDNRSNTWLEYLSRVDQQSDGMLEITIQKIFSDCLSIGQPIKINSIVKNISTQPVFLNSNFKISPRKISLAGNMLPVFFTNDLLIIYQPSDLYDPGFENPLEILEGVKLIPGEVYQGEIELAFPDQIVDDLQVDTMYVTPKTGVYFVKIIYSNITEMDSYWKGKISSNLLEICVE